jgi:3-hydroxyisobutyrate dehydrogenase-like beta-hydroxyacid dehydrogenase
MRERLGFVGLGSLGAALASLTIDAGYLLAVLNVAPEALPQLTRKGGLVHAALATSPIKPRLYSLACPSPR